MRSRLATVADKIAAAKACCKAALANRNLLGFDELLNGDWKVLVIKRDANSGEFTTETLCCAEPCA